MMTSPGRPCFWPLAKLSPVSQPVRQPLQQLACPNAGALSLTAKTLAHPNSRPIPRETTSFSRASSIPCIFAHHIAAQTYSYQPPLAECSLCTARLNRASDRVERSVHTACLIWPKRFPWALSRNNSPTFTCHDANHTLRREGFLPVMRRNASGTIFMQSCPGRLLVNVGRPRLEAKREAERLLSCARFTNQRDSYSPTHPPGFMA